MYSSPKVWILRLFCCALFWAGGASVFAQNTAKEDDFLQLLRQELDTLYDSLRHTNYPPYFMAYRVNEVVEHRLSANFGYVYDNTSKHSIFLTIELRVGDQERDNYHYLSCNSHPILKRIELPLDFNPVLLRKILVRETQQAHYESVIQLIHNNTNASLLQRDEDESYAFQSFYSENYYEPPLSDTYLDVDLWSQQLRYCTNAANMFPDLTEASAAIVFQVNRKYLVTSDKCNIVENLPSATITLRVEGMTLDKQLEHIEHQHYAHSLEQLPDASVLAEEVLNMETLLSNMLHTTNEKPDLYAGNVPVLLSEKAASILAHHLFGHPIENDHNGDIANLKLRDDFTVVSDPTLRNFHGLPLSSSYIYDDEGVKSQRVILFGKEGMRELLSTRTQAPGNRNLNGHARGGRRLPSAKVSNLLVSTSKPLEKTALFDQLAAEIRQQNKNYGLYVADADVRCDTSGLVSIYPTVCYMVFAQRSPNEEIRNVIISGSVQQWIDNLIAGGDTPGSVSIICHNRDDETVTHSCCPALLFRSAEVNPVAENIKDRKIRIFNQILPPDSSDYDIVADLFFRAAKDEQISDNQYLTVDKINAPYYQDYLMTDVRVLTVRASEGSILYANEKPVRQVVPRTLLGSDLNNNENLHGELQNPPEGYRMSTDNLYNAFVRDIRKATDAEYQKATHQKAAKEAVLQLTGVEHLRDRSEITASQTYDERVPDMPALVFMEHLAAEISTALAKHGFLHGSGVNIYTLAGNVYYWNSEKTSYSRPVTIIVMQLYGSVEKAGGGIYSDGKTVFLPCTDSLYFSNEIQREINLLVSHLRRVKNDGTTFQGQYYGPLLIEGEAVGQLLDTVLLGNHPNLFSHREPVSPSEQTDGHSTESFEESVNQIITSKKLSVTANKSGDEFDRAVFCRHEKTDADGVEISETEIIRDGELITLMGNRIPTKSTPYSNGFQQLALHDEGCFATKGASRIDVFFKKEAPHGKLKKMLLQEAKRQGCEYAYILRQVDDNSTQDIAGREASCREVLQLYRVDVRTGKEMPVTGAKTPVPQFNQLENLLCVSDTKASFPVMTRVPGAAGSRDFPFAGVPTCIVAPDALLFKCFFIEGTR